MYCTNCGKEINDNADVCIHCRCSVIKTKADNDKIYKAAQIMGATLIVISVILFVAGAVGTDSDYMIGSLISLVIGIGINIASKVFRSK